MRLAYRSVRPNFIGMSSDEVQSMLDFYAPVPHGPEGTEAGLVPVNEHDYRSQALPIGYQTALAFLALNDPVTLSFMDAVPEAMDEDEKLLLRECLRMNMRRVEVPSCRWLAQQGIFLSWAYPVRILMKHFHI